MGDIMVTPTELFSFKSDTVVKARICHIYDGDTVHLVFIFKGDVIKVIGRLYGIDTPELAVKEQYVSAIRARNRLIQLATDWNIELDNEVSSKSKEYNTRISSNTKIIDVLFKGNDKYGRELVELFSDGQCINQTLVTEGYCYQYFGGTKTI
jgi:endonuclease YncB( thermonuclease family)